MQLRSQGFSLIELVIVIVLIGIISMLIGRFLFAAYNTFITSNDISEADWQSFIAVERLLNDIHSLSPSDLSTIQATNLVFTNVNGASVQFQLSGNTLLRNSQLLANGIQSFSLTYLDQSGVTTAIPGSVRYINIALTIKQGNITTSFNTLAATRALP